MRILHFVHGFPPECRGGTETFVARLLQGLAAVGHDVAVVTGSQQTWPVVGVERRDYEGFKVFVIHRSALYLDSWERTLAPEVHKHVHDVVREFRPDVAHIHHWLRLDRMVGTMVQELGVRTVITLHDLTPTCPRNFRIRDGSYCDRPLGAESCLGCAPTVFLKPADEVSSALELYRDEFALELASADALIAPTEFQRELFGREFPAIAGRIRVIPFAATDRSPLKTTKPPPSEHLRIGHWGNLDFLKGVDIILEAVARLAPDEREQVELHIFGNIVFPTERPQIEALASQVNAKMHGTYEMQELIDIPLDLAIFASRCVETYGYVLDEAFRLGLPAIVPNRGALAQRLNGRGMVFRPEDPADLARVLSEVIKNRRLLETWTSADPGLRSFEDQVDDLTKVYESITLDPGQRCPPAPLRFQRRFEFLVRQAENLTNQNIHTAHARQHFQAETRRLVRLLDEMDSHCRAMNAEIERLLRVQPRR